MRIVGVDPALRYTGLALLDNGKARTVTIETPHKEWVDVIGELSRWMMPILRFAQLVVIETEIVYARGVRQLAPLAKVQGAIGLMITMTGIDYLYVTPRRLRSYAGMKRRDKGGKLKQWFGIHGKTDHEVDALVLALIGACKLQIYPATKHQKSLLDRMPIKCPSSNR